MGNRTPTWSRIMSTVLVVVVTLVAIMPLVAHAMFTNIARDGFYIPPKSPPSNGGSGSSGSGSGSGNTGNTGSTSSTSTTTSSKTVTLTNTTTTVTITKTYTQVVTQTYVINHYIEYYLYPLLKWVFTLVNIGSQQAPGYHSVGNQLMFTPGFGSGSGIFVPVYAQEAIYAINIAPSTKPQITGWYVGSTSQSSSPPSLASQSVNTYLSNIQQTVNTIQDQVKVTLTNTTTIINNTKIVPKPGSNNTQYITNQLPTPYYYSPQDITTAYQTSYHYWLQTVSDLLHGNIIGAAQSFAKAWRYNDKGTYEQVYDFYSGVVSTLYNAVADPKYTWSIAHALSVGNIIGAAGTVLSNAGQALINGWNHSVGWALNQVTSWFSHL
jgi:hypothetical protein